MKRLIPVFKPVLLATPCHRAHRALRASHFCSFSKPGRLRIDRLSSGFPHQAPEALIPNRAEDLKESRTVATEITVGVYRIISVPINRWWNV
jgi:hypothetical protein